MKFEWEEINRVAECNKELNFNRIDFTSRAKVYGGWMVKHEFLWWPTANRMDIPRTVNTESMIFVPDANHEWVIEK
jgi:hypothetical protein